MGRIASLTSGVDAGPTPMAREIQGFIRLVSMIAITTGSIIFIVAMVHLKKKLPNNLQIFL
jgi:sodium/potassium-transporting ATPase subunit alpha